MAAEFSKVPYLIALFAFGACDRPSVHAVQGAPASSGGAPATASSSAVSNDAGVEAKRLESASSTAITPDGSIVMRGVDGAARHMHGGPPAELSWFKVQVENRGTRERTLSVGRIDFLGGRSCDAAPSDVRTELRVAGIMPDDGSLTESVLKLRVAPGANLGVSVSFRPSVTAYYTFCDRFAFRAQFLADDTSLTVVSETRVTRVEPLRNGR